MVKVNFWTRLVKQCSCAVSRKSGGGVQKVNGLEQDMIDDGCQGYNLCG